MNDTTRHDTTTADASMEREAFEALIDELRRTERAEEDEDAWAAYGAIMLAYDALATGAAISETNASTERQGESIGTVEWLEGLPCIRGMDDEPVTLEEGTYLFTRPYLQEELDLARAQGKKLYNELLANNPDLAPKEAAEPTREDGVGFETWASDEGLFLGSYDTQAGANYIDAETQGAWRGWHAALATPRTEAAAVAPDAPLEPPVMTADEHAMLYKVEPDWAFMNIHARHSAMCSIYNAGRRSMIATHSAAPSNVREQALDAARWREAQRIRTLVDGTINAQVYGEAIDRAVADRALKSATPDAGKTTFEYEYRKYRGHVEPMWTDWMPCPPEKVCAYQLEQGTDLRIKEPKP